MAVDLDKMRGMIRDAPAGATVVVAPDVYDALVAGRLGEAVDISESLRSTQVRRSASLRPGTAMVMSGEHPQGSKGWAGEFLSRSGPALPFAAATLYDVAAPPPPPPPSQQQQPPPRQRTRVVDT